MGILTLEMVEKAIQEVMLNQSYEINGRKFTRADLDALRALRKDMKEELRDGNVNNKTLPKGKYNVSFK